MNKMREDKCQETCVNERSYKIIKPGLGTNSKKKFIKIPNRISVLSLADRLCNFVNI